MILGQLKIGARSTTYAALTSTNEMLTKLAAIGSLLLTIFILSITDSLLGCFCEIKTNQCTEDCEFCGAGGKLYTSVWIQQSWSWFQSRPGFLSGRWQHLSPARQGQAEERMEFTNHIRRKEWRMGWCWCIYSILFRWLSDMIYFG